MHHTPSTSLLTGIAISFSHSPDIPGPTSAPRATAHAVDRHSPFVALCGAALSEVPDGGSSWADGEMGERCPACELIALGRTARDH